MGEVINNLLKGLAWLLGTLLVIGGIYTGIAGLGADAATAFAADGATKYEDLHNQAEARRWESGVVDFYTHHWAWTFHMAIHPGLLQRAWGKAFPPIIDLGQYSKGNWWNGRIVRMTFTQRNLTYHFAGPIVGGMILAVLLEVIMHPLVRSGVARMLATTNKKIWGKPRNLPCGDGFVLAKSVRLPRNGGGNPHVATFSPSGGKKTSCQAIPSILQLPDDCGAVITDMKGEIYARCHRELHRRGHKIIVLGPMAGFGTGWDPLKTCKKPDDCRKLARQLIVAGDESSQANGGNWTNISRTRLSASMIQAWADGLGLADAFQNLYSDDESGESLSHPGAILDFRMYEGMKQSAGTSGSVWGTIQGSCQVWLSDEVVGWMACERQFNMEDIRKGAVVFLISTEDDIEESQAIQKVIFSRLFKYLASSQGTDVRIYMDEFANLGAVSGIDRALNLLRSAGVGIHAFLQNPSQLFKEYGRDAGNVVMESFGTICVMGGLRGDAADLARLLGEDEDVKPNYSTQDEKMRAGFTPQRRQAFDGAMLRQLRSNQVLIVSGNHKPCLAKLKPWYSRFSRLRYRVFPRIFRRDWKDVPSEARTRLFNGIRKIDPVALVIPPKPKKDEGYQGEKLKRKKTVRIDMEDLAGALAPHIQSQMSEAEDGYMDALVSSTDPFSGLNVGADNKEPNTDA